MLVEADAGCALEALVEALRAEGLAGPGPLRAAGRLLDGGSSLGAVLHDGLLLVSGGDPAPAAPTLLPDRSERHGASDPASAAALAVPPVEGEVELRFVGGPEAGRTVRLGPGRYVVGRGDEADIRLGADPLVSRRHAELVVSGDGVEIVDLGAANKVLVAGCPLAGGRLAEHEAVQLGETVVAWAAVAAADAVVASDGEGHVVLNRPPRILPEPVVHHVTVPLPATRPSRPAFSVVGAAIPLLAGVAIAVALHQPVFLLFAVLSPLTGLANHLSARRSGSQAHRLAQGLAADATRDAADALRQALEAEADERRRAAPDPATLAGWAFGPGARLWERRRGDPDFCHLRLGLADQPARAVRLDGPAAEPESLVLTQVPAVLDLPAAGVVGVAGPAAARRALARALIVQACTLHAPEDLQLAVCASDGPTSDWSFVRLLPHARPDDGPSARLAATPDTLAGVAGGLAQLVDDRLRRLETAGPERVAGEPLVLVVLDGAYQLRAAPLVARLLRRGPEVGVACIALDEAEALLPEECTTTVTFGAGEPTRCTLRSTGAAPLERVLADLAGTAFAEATARALAPVRCSGHGADATLPSSVRLLELLDLDPPSSSELARRWAGSDGAPRAVLGRTGLGACAVDLRRDGPHGLVAGTTGAGKSELLQTLVAGLAAAVPPDALTFVLVDYKGGAAFTDAARLPHTVGMVTDLDAHLTARALASLGAELRRRERLFQAAGARDLDEYWRATGDGLGRRRLARLLIVVDELAALVEELPGFVDGLVDLARRGRSLGIHLLLATQRPSGVVSPSIRTNTNLRVALRVTDAADSLDVVDAPTAAHIRKETPGRAFVRVGHDELVEVQTASVSGRPPRSGPAAGVRLVRLDGVAPGGAAPGGAAGRAAAAAGGGVPGRDDDLPEPDLVRLVEAARSAATALGLGPARRPWLPPLPSHCTLDELPALAGSAPGSPTRLAFGVEDHPDEQARVLAAYDLEAGGHLLVAGDAGSGRSSLLRALAVSAARALPPADLHCYVLDGGNGALSALELLPHCGAVVSRLEPERVERLLGRLADEVARRHQSLALGGFASLQEARAAGGPGGDLPYLLLLVDRYEGFLAAFDAHDGGRLVSALLQLLRDGPSAGLRVVLAGDRSVLAGRLPSLAETTVVLRLNDRTGYALAGLDAASLPEPLPPGRGVRVPSGAELQVALLAGDPSGPAQAAAVTRLGRELARACREAGVAGTTLPEPIGALPSVVALSRLGPGTGSGLLVGVGGDHVLPLRVPLEDRGGFLVVGPARSGRSNTLAVLARSLLAAGRPVVVLAPRPSPLASLAGAPGVTVLAGRDLAGDGAVAVLDGLPAGAAVLVDDANLLDPSGLTEAVARCARSAADTGHLVVAAAPPPEAAVALRGLLPELRRARAGVVLCPQAPTDGEALGVRLPHSLLAAGPPGRAVLAVDGLLTPLQVPLDDWQAAEAARR